MKDHVQYDDNNIRHMFAWLNHVKEIQTECWERRMDDIQAQHDLEEQANE
jgi:hypothetical protein